MMEQDPTHPTGVSSNNAGGSALTRARDRKAAAALQMKQAGETWEDIAEVLGYPTGRMALVATEKALEKQLGTAESQKFLRQLASRRLDQVLRAIYPKAIDPEDPEQMIAATKVREIIATSMKLHGLEAPTQIVHHSPHESEIDAWVAEVVTSKIPALTEADIFGDVVEGEIVEEPVHAASD